MTHDEIRVANQRNVRLSGRCVTLFDVFRQDPRRGGFVYCGLFRARGHNAKEIVCLDALHAAEVAH